MPRINKLYLSYMSGDIIPGLHSVIPEEKRKLCGSKITFYYQTTHVKNNI